MVLVETLVGLDDDGRGLNQFNGVDRFVSAADTKLEDRREVALVAVVGLVGAAGAVGGYLLSRGLGNNNNGKADNSAELTLIANKLDQTNELLNELLRSHARLEGALSK